MAGFPRPFLHGLCTFGVVGRALLDALCAGDPARFLGLSVRFSGIVEPGDDLRVDVWRDGDGDASFEATTPRGPALSHGRFTFQASIDDQEAKVPTTREDAKTGGSAT